MISSTVVRSLYTGMTTDSSGSERSIAHAKRTSPYHTMNGVLVDPRAELARRRGDGAARDRRRPAAAAGATIDGRGAAVGGAALRDGAGSQRAHRARATARSAGWMARRRAAARRFDAALLLPNSFHSASRRRGPASPSAGATAPTGVGCCSPARVAAPNGVHQIEYYQHLARALGFPAGRRSRAARFRRRARRAARGADARRVGRPCAARGACAGRRVRRRQALAARVFRASSRRCFAPTASSASWSAAPADGAAGRKC